MLALKTGASREKIQIIDRLFNTNAIRNANHSHLQYQDLAMNETGFFELVLVMLLQYRVSGIERSKIAGGMTRFRWDH